MATQSRLDTRHSLPAAEGLTDEDRYKFVTLGAEAALTGADELGVPLLAVEGESATVALDNKQKIRLGGNVSAGAELSSDANGLAITAATGVVNGIALEDGVEGQIISYFVLHK